MDEAKLAQLVREQLRHHHPGGVTLDVIEGEIRQRDGYWWVPIRPSAQPPKMYEYYEALAEVEATLEENEQLDIQLVPTVPEEAPPTPKDASPASGKDLAPDAQPRDKSVRRFRDE